MTGNTAALASIIAALNQDDSMAPMGVVYALKAVLRELEHQGHRLHELEQRLHDHEQLSPPLDGSAS